MSTIKSSTTSTTAYQVVADTTGTLVFQTGATPTTAMTLGSDQSVTFAGAQTYTGGATFNSSISVQGITVGRGAGAVSTNTAVGASALAANTTAVENTAIGYYALKDNTGVTNTAVGAYAAYLTTTGNGVSAFGDAALQTNTTGTDITGVGKLALQANTTGNYNTAVGRSALHSNTTASNNTAVGYQAGYSNVAATDNTFIGYQAGYSSNRSSGAPANVCVGSLAGYGLTTGYRNTFIGPQTSGVGSGYYVTTGYNNTIIGGYSGNQGGLDIRTASNYIVLSDGDGNPKAYNGNNVWYFGDGSAVQSGDIRLNGQASSGWGPVIGGYTGTPGSLTGRWYAGSNSWIKGGTAYDTFTVMAGASGGVNLAATGTSWTSASDERLKDIIEPITNATTKVASLRAVIGKYKTDEEGVRRSFLIAQDVQAVLPEAISESRNSKNDDTEYLQLAYTEVIPLLVAAIKELKAELDTAKAQIAALQGAAQ